MKSTVVIIDRSKIYISHLEKYIANKYGNSLEIVGFTSLIPLKKYIRQNSSNISLLIINESIKSASKLEFNNIIFLCENKNDKNTNSIYKYQSVSKFIDDILKHISCEEQNEINTHLILFYSNSNQMSKTKSVIKVASALGKREKVFYLNLESFSMLKKYVKFSDDTKNIANLLYAMKEKSKQIDLSKYITETSENFDSFVPSENAMELACVDWEKIKRLIGLIKSLDYKYILLDIDIKFDNIAYELVNLSELIIILKDDKEKTKMLNKTLVSILGSEEKNKKCVEIEIEDKNSKFSEKIIDIMGDYFAGR